MKTYFKYIFVLLPLVLSMCSPKNPVGTVSDPKWVAMNKGLTSMTIQCIAPAPDQAKTIYIGTLDGVFVTEDGGKNWQPRNDGLTTRDSKSLVTHPQNGSLVFCGSWGSGVFKSANAGLNWTSVWNSEQNPFISAVAYGSNGTLWAATRSGLFKSIDQGLNWNKAYADGIVTTVAVNPVNPKEIFIGVEYRGNFKSSDNGNTWLAINEGIYWNDTYGVLAANNYSFNPKNTAILFLSTGSVDIYKSVNGGLSWTQYPHDASDFKVVSVTVDPVNPQNVWAATQNRGVMMSIDGGEKWSQKNNGLPTLQLKAIGVTGGNTSELFVGTIGEGIFKYSE